MEAFVQQAVKKNGPKGDNVTALAVFPQNQNSLPL